MSNLNQVEMIAEENIRLSNDEKKFAACIKSIASTELRRSKIRKKLGKEESKLAELRKSYVEQFIRIADKKFKLKDQGYIDFSDEEFLTEKEQSDYFNKISEIHAKIADITNKEADIEAKIGRMMSSIASQELKLSKVRRNLGNAQKAFATFFRQHPPEQLAVNPELNNKKVKLENRLITLGHDITLIKNEIIGSEKQIKALENNLAILIRALSIKLSEREKIRQ